MFAMARPVRDLGVLVGAVLACAALLAPTAWAGDRYGAYGDGYANGGADDYQARDFDLSSVYGAPYEARRGSPDDYGRDRGDGYQDDRADRSAYAQTWREQRDSRAETYGARRFDDVEEIDPCAAQRRVIGRGCGPAVDGRPREGGYREGYDGRYDDVEAVDPCAMQYRFVGRGCGGGYERETYEEPYAPEYRDERVWRGGAGYDDRETWVDGREAYEGGAVDACEVVHERMGGHCPYARQPVEAPAPTEDLPDSFFISEGGVGPGIVDFGGGGGGGFEFADTGASAAASATASASASARARISLRYAVMAHNHYMMHHHPMKWGGGWGGRGGGCGCKK